MPAASGGWDWSVSSDFLALDRLFGKTLFTQKIDAPPFYFGRETLETHYTIGGIRINPQAAVLRRTARCSRAFGPRARPRGHPRHEPTRRGGLHRLPGLRENRGAGGRPCGPANALRNRGEKNRARLRPEEMRNQGLTPFLIATAREDPAGEQDLRRRGRRRSSGEARGGFDIPRRNNDIMRLVSQKGKGGAGRRTRQ